MKFEKFIKFFFLGIIILFLAIGLVLPLSELLVKSFYQMTPSGEKFVGLQNFIDYFSSKNQYSSLINSCILSCSAAAIATFLSFCGGYAMQRTQIIGKNFFKTIFMLPLYTPTIFYGLALIYLFGRQGIFTHGFFGFLPNLEIPIYGFLGTLIAEVLYIFPPSLIIMSVAFEHMDARLYDAANSLNSSSCRTFFKITLPGVKTAIFSVFIAGFTMVFTDFGAPKVIGGNFNVLAVDIYKKVVGQQDFNMGATISILLLLPSIFTFLISHYIQKRQVSMFNAKSVPYIPEKNRCRDLSILSFILVPAIFIIVVFGGGIFASLVKNWPYDFSLTLSNFTYETLQGSSPLFNSILIAILSAVFGTILTMLTAYFITKTECLKIIKNCIEFLALLPLALPGMVVGFSYIFFFSKPQIFGFSNPLNVIYGSLAILIFSNVIHFFSMGFITAKTALTQLDKEFESVAQSMNIPFWTTFRRVTLPTCIPAMLEIGMYYFASSMTTISAIIFLYSNDTTPATVAVVNLNDSGDQAPALAICIGIIFINIVMKIIVDFIGKKLRKKQNNWKIR